MMLLQIAWRSYVRRFDIILFANLIIALPFNILLDITTPRHLYGTELADPILNTQIFLQDFSGLLRDPIYSTNLIINVISGVMFVYVAVAITITMKQVYLRKNIAARVILKKALAFLPAALGTVIIVRVIIFFGTLVFIIPGLGLALFLSLAIPALVWHELNPWQALVKSFHTVKKNWFGVLSYTILANLITSAIILMVIMTMPDVLGFKALSLTISTIIASFIPMFTVVLFTALDLDLSKDASA